MKKILVIFVVVISLCVANHAQEIRRPTTETTTIITPAVCGGTWYSGNLPNFWDSGGNATFSSQTAAGTSTSQRYKAAVISGFSSASGSYASLNLIIDWSCSNTHGGGCTISHSINGGSSFTVDETVVVAGSEHVLTISLPPAQDLTKLQIKWETCGAQGSVPSLITSAISGYDIRTEGILASTDKKRFQVTTTE